MIENLYLFLLYSYIIYSLDVNNQEKDNNQVHLLLAIEEIFELKEDRTDRITVKDMVEQFQILADEGKVNVEDVSEITTVTSWIT
ncbi:hypothetical protein RCL_jg27289.t1 [Rhizophagus clarus]|uniref:EF-hand domain-containing protein n=1 Tax=Rhizophagus clarus TaxID=94130 RepID=A0A8H3QV74_9GLOM|nr:hypothetical protein RCL_jg27289.t1 [Rhizophagus clarus]